MNGRIISSISGGLGNQMFQYAAGRALAIRSNSVLVLDRRYFVRKESIEFGLGNFNIHVSAADGNLPPLRRGQRIRYLFWRYLKLSPQLIKERGLGFDRRMLSPRTDVYLDGFWQSERYFSDVAETIRKDFRIVTPPSPENAAHLANIAACPAVSLHVRRGDYLSPKHQAYHGTCSIEYYTKALEFVSSRMASEPVVYVFSDEPEWAYDNLALPFEKRVMAHNGPERNYEDMRLMSACRHHIIANSTFSWWGAWLNPSPDKIVVAPQRWFADPRVDNPDIIPHDWHQLPQ